MAWVFGEEKKIVKWDFIYFFLSETRKLPQIIFFDIVLLFLFVCLVLALYFHTKGAFFLLHFETRSVLRSVSNH